MIETRSFSDTQALNDACAALMQDVLQPGPGGPRAVMLSGGRTPLALFKQIAAAPFAVDAEAYLTYTDDRHVPIESPDSNFGATLPMIEALGLPLPQVLRVDTSVSLEESATRFDAALAGFLEQGGRIPVAFLGMGADGHTCSLFSQEDIDRGIGRYASPTWRPEPPHRVTVTPKLLERCERIIFLVTGADKEAVVRQLLDTPTAIPAGRATSGCVRVELWRA